MCSGYVSIPKKVRSNGEIEVEVFEGVPGVSIPKKVRSNHADNY